MCPLLFWAHEKIAADKSRSPRQLHRHTAPCRLAAHDSTPEQGLAVGSVAFLDGGRDVGSTLKLSGSRIILLRNSRPGAWAAERKHALDARHTQEAAVATPHGSSMPEVGW